MLQRAANLEFLSRVAQAGQSQTHASGAVFVEEATDTVGPAHRNDRGSFGLEVAASPARERIQRLLVAHPLDEDRGSNVLHQPEPSTTKAPDVASMTVPQRVKLQLGGGGKEAPGRCVGNGPGASPPQIPDQTIA